MRQKETNAKRTARQPVSVRRRRLEVLITARVVGVAAAVTAERGAPAAACNMMRGWLVSALAMATSVIVEQGMQLAEQNAT